MTIKQDVEAIGQRNGNAETSTKDELAAESSSENNETAHQNNPEPIVVSESDAMAVSSASQIAREQHLLSTINSENGGHQDDALIEQWKASPFAVGYTKPAWEDENVNCLRICNSCGSFDKPHECYMLFTALLCRSCGCRPGRVGNLFVLKQRMVPIPPEEDNAPTDEEQPLEPAGDQILAANVSSNDSSARNARRPKSRPRLQCVVGPYFLLTTVATIPVLLALTVFTFFQGILNRSSNLHWAIILGWALVTFVMFYSLLRTSCGDPGVLYRHSRIPTGAAEDAWFWNDQAQSYRPRGAKFDSETQTIVEQYDHTCPWVGTAIGRRNMPSFQRFLWFLGFMIAYDIALLVIV